MIKLLNIAGVTAEVLLDAYELKDDEEYLDAAIDTGDYIISELEALPDEQHFNAFNMVFLQRLSNLSGYDTYSDFAESKMYHLMNDVTFWKDSSHTICGGDELPGCTPEELVEAESVIRSWSNDPTGIAVWDLYHFIEFSENAGESSFADELGEEINDYISDPDFNEEMEYYIIGLCGGIIGLSDAGLDYDSYLTDLLDEQDSDGFWEDENGIIQNTAYAIMALRETGEFEAAQLASDYLVDNFGYEGLNGWLENNDREYSEVTSEAAQALAELEMIYPEISNVYIEPTYPNCKEESIPVWVYSTIIDESGVQDYPTLKWRIVEGDYGSPSMNSEGEDEYSGIIGITQPEDGMEVEYKIVAENNLENEGYTSFNFEHLFTYDCSPPETTIEIGNPKYEYEYNETLTFYYVTSSTEFTLDATDEISGVNATYYAICGGETEEEIEECMMNEDNWVEYDGNPFSIIGDDGMYVIGFGSVDNAGNSEEGSEGDNYIIIILDNTSPEVTLEDLDEFYNSVPIILNFTYSDSGSGVKEYKIWKWRHGGTNDQFVDITNSNPPIAGCIDINNGDGTYTTTCEFIDGSQDGEFSFKIEVIDNVENSQNSTIRNTILDTTSPTITSDYTDGWKHTDQTVTLNPEDPLEGKAPVNSGIKEVKYCEGVDCEPDITLGSPYEILYTTDQITILRYQTWDNAGNPSGIGENEIKIDKTKPITTISFDSTEWQTSDININLTCEDPETNGVKSGCDKIYYCISYEDDCDPWEGEEYTDTINYGEEGTHYIRFASNDSAGNVEETKSQVIKIDKTSPTIEITNILDGANITCFQSVTAEITDETSGVNFVYATILNSTDIIANKTMVYDSSRGVWDTTFAGLCSKEVGNYTIEVTAYDVAGNSNSDEKDVYFPRVVAVFSESPTCNVDSNTGGTCTMEFSFWIRGGNAVMMSMSDINVAAGSLSPTEVNATIFNNKGSAAVGNVDASGPVWNGGILEVNTPVGYFNLDLTLPANFTASTSVDYYIKPVIV